MDTRQMLAELMARPFLTRADLSRRYCRDISTIRNWKRKKLLPRPVEFYGPLWRLSDLIRFEKTKCFRSMMARGDKSNGKSKRG